MGNNMTAVPYVVPDDVYSPPQKQIFNPATFWILSAGWALYVLLAPIYIFGSGMPQPADMIMALVVPFTVLAYIMSVQLIFNRTFVCLLMIAALFFSINIIHFYFYQDRLFLMAGTYYVYNSLVFATTVILFRHNPAKMAALARWIILITLFYQLAYVFFIEGDVPGRHRGSFNNPNQLGYWSMLSAIYLLVLQYGKRISLVDIAAIGIATFLIAESLSRAALVSHVLVLGVLFLGAYMSLFARAAVIFSIFLFMLIQVAFFFTSEQVNFEDWEIYKRVDNRIASIETDEGALGERGYQRILNYPEYMVYGAGEGSQWRFAEKREIQYKGAAELHSGLATILMSYGAFGFLLFAAFVYTIFQRVPWLLWLTLAAVMAYGITHQHVRFTGFWIYLGLMYSASRYLYPASRKNGSE